MDTETLRKELFITEYILTRCMSWLRECNGQVISESLLNELHTIRYLARKEAIEQWDKDLIKQFH
jgi:hypothetical protein